MQLPEWDKSRKALLQKTITKYSHATGRQLTCTFKVLRTFSCRSEMIRAFIIGHNREKLGPPPHIGHQHGNTWLRGGGWYWRLANMDMMATCTRPIRALLVGNSILSTLTMITLLYGGDHCHLWGWEFVSYCRYETTAGCSLSLQYAPVLRWLWVVKRKVGDAASHHEAWPPHPELSTK